ncbi:hypothetical protein ACIBG8_07505 [Nonomuraea sp. NPDC050556]|uniref:hypothetical protein n=1 Tax=Nonomuraea sp. NPDC050556 TaxID=3364369 RepID=UPI00378FBE73
MTVVSRLRVPYVTAYDEECVQRPFAVVLDAGATEGWRLGFVGAGEQDWMLGVLWYRPGLHRRGKPEWRLVNTLRQRRCMLYLLCQVCGGTAVNDDRRINWVLAESPEMTPQGVPFTNAPPTCQGCVSEALDSCPRLGSEARVYTVRAAAPYAVVGDVVQISQTGLSVAEWNRLITIDSFRQLEHTLAKQLLVTLDDLQPSSA